jgi:hypothetical protein
MLQGFADDSGSDGQRVPHFLGGFLMEAERWAAFADAWQAQLSRSPSIKYFKMNEAHALSGEFAQLAFHGIETRHRKVRDMLEVIEDFKPVGVFSTVDWEEFRFVQEPFVRGDVKDPYQCLIPWLFDVVMAWQKQEGIFPQPIDFDFDDQGMRIGAAIRAVFPEVKRLAPDSLRKMLGRNPMMLDDKKVLPLQAADMLVWNLRRHYDPKVEYREWEWLYARLNALCFGGAFGPRSYDGLQMFNVWQWAVQRLGQ